MKRTPTTLLSKDQARNLTNKHIEQILKKKVILSDIYYIIKYSLYYQLYVIICYIVKY